MYTHLYTLILMKLTSNTPHVYPPIYTHINEAYKQYTSCIPTYLHACIRHIYLCTNAHRLHIFQSHNISTNKTMFLPTHTHDTSFYSSMLNSIKTCHQVPTATLEHHNWSEGYSVRQNATRNVDTFFMMELLAKASLINTELLQKFNLDIKEHHMIESKVLMEN